MKQLDEDIPRNNDELEADSEARADETGEQSPRPVSSEAVLEPEQDNAEIQPDAPVPESLPAPVFSFNSSFDMPSTKKKKKRHPSASLWE